jgi:hypothetical protein
MAPVIKHILLAKFKDSITPEQEKDLIDAYAALPNSISAMKGFEWCVLHLLFCFFPDLFNLLAFGVLWVLISRMSVNHCRLNSQHNGGMYITIKESSL